MGQFGTISKLLESLVGPWGYICALGSIFVFITNILTPQSMDLRLLLSPSLIIFAIRQDCVQLSTTAIRAD